MNHHRVIVVPHSHALSSKQLPVFCYERQDAAGFSTSCSPDASFSGSVPASPGMTPPLQSSAVCCLYDYSPQMCVLLCFIDPRVWKIRGEADSRAMTALPAGSVIVWTKSRAQYEYMSIDVVSMHMYILPIFVYSTLFAWWECACVDEVSCSMYTYIYGCCRSCIYILSLFVSLCIYIYIGAGVSEIYVCIATIRPHNSASLLGVWLCGRSRVFDVYIHLWILSLLYIHVVTIYASDVNIYFVTICLHNSACLLGVWLCGRSRMLKIYLCL